MIVDTYMHNTGLWYVRGLSLFWSHVTHKQMQTKALQNTSFNYVLVQEKPLNSSFIDSA